jgi:hypothetical protein
VEANPPLVIDAYRMLPGSIPAQDLQPIAGRNSQIVEALRPIQEAEFDQRLVLNVARELAAPPTVPNPLGFSVSKPNDHNAV